MEWDVTQGAELWLLKKELKVSAAKIMREWDE
jgi:hypothetical protein